MTIELVSVQPTRRARLGLRDTCGTSIGSGDGVFKRWGVGALECRVGALERRASGERVDAAAERRDSGWTRQRWWNAPALAHRGREADTEEEQGVRRRMSRAQLARQKMSMTAVRIGVSHEPVDAAVRQRGSMDVSEGRRVSPNLPLRLRTAPHMEPARACSRYGTSAARIVPQIARSGLSRRHGRKRRNECPACAR